MPSLALLGQSLLSGIFVGALYGLLGLGLSLAWGLLGQINLAHFALAVLGAYLTYQLASAGLDPFFTLALILPAFFVLGVALHSLFARFAVGAFNSLLITFGLTVIIEAGIQWIWSADFRRLESHYAAVGLWAALRYTDFGKAIRASAEDSAMAQAYGVNARALALLLSGISAALAGVAGLCIALSYTLAPSQIYAWVGVVFAVVMLGGLGSALGPLIAGIVIGVSEAITMALTAPSWAPLVSFSLLIALLVLRPEKL